MRFLTEFEYDTFEHAMDIHSKIYELMRKNGYVTYADVLKFGLFQPLHSTIPDLYNKMGWINLWGAKVEGRTLIMPPITNIESKIKYVKENQNEKSNNKDNQ